MRRYIKIFLAFAVVIALIWGGVRLHIRLTDGFTLGQIIPQPYQTEDLPDPPHYTNEEIKKTDLILSQDFYYIGKGSQSYAFRSADGQHVIKFVKQKHISPTTLESFICMLPGTDNFRETRMARYKERWQLLVTGAYLANRMLKDESRLVFFHLSPTEGLFSRQVTIHDKLGLTYKIDIDKHQFYIQEYLVTLRKALTEWDDEKIKVGLSRLINLLLARSKKQIQEDDHLILENMGFIGTDPVFLDIGRLRIREELNNPEIYASVLYHDVAPIQRFLQKHHPELKKWFDEELAQSTLELSPTQG